MKYRKRVAIILSLLLIFSNAIAVAATEKESKLPKAYVKVTSSLNVREGPSTRYDVVSSLKPGDLVSIEQSTKDGWSKVVLADGSQGYVFNQYIVTPDVDTESYELISAAVITQKSSSANRNFNMSKACEAIDELVLQPGDEFNWYGDEDTEAVVGRASKANGYKQATVISGGKYVTGYGGGVCQVSTAVYNCILKLEIEPTEHHHHSLQSSYVAKGMDATVAYSEIKEYMKNFVFTNTLDYPIMFEAYTDGGQVIILAYKVLEESAKK